MAKLAKTVPARGPGAGGAGVGAEPVFVGGSSLRGASVGRAVPGGARTRGAGAPFTGPRESGTGRIVAGGAGSGGGATGALESDPRATNAPDTTPPPHPYLTRHLARLRLAPKTVPARGPGAGGAGVGAEPVFVGGSSLRGAGVGRAVPGGARTRGAGAPFTGPRESGTGRIVAGGAGSGGGATGVARVGAGGARVGAAAARATAVGAAPAAAGEVGVAASAAGGAAAAAAGAAAAAAGAAAAVAAAGAAAAAATSASCLWPLDPRSPSPSPPPSPSPLVYGPTFPPPAPTPAVFPRSQPPLSPPLSHAWTSRSPSARPLFPIPLTDLRIVQSVLVRLVLTEFASTRRLNYTTSLVAAPPTCPLAIGGESALGCDALEDKQFELEFLEAASPHLCAMLLAPEGDPDALDISTPRTYAKVVSGPWASQWRAAMDSEMASYRSTGTYTFAPTPKMTNLRVLLHVEAQREYKLHSLDFSTAFLQGSLHEEVWLRRPSAFTGTFPPGTQWRLRRPVYGIRQAPREWHNTLRSTLSDLGFQPSSADPSLFVRRGSTLFFLLEDLDFTTADRVALADMKHDQHKRHTCTDLCELRHYLGLQITMDRAAPTITLSHSHMVQEVLQRFELQHSTVQPTPLAVDHRLTGPFRDEPFEPSGPYAELVGCLMYLMTCTRPDLAFPLSILTRFVALGRHHPVHWRAAMRVAKYLAMTSGVGLVLGGRQSVVLIGHCDSSYADDAETHRSTQGYCFILGSGAVSWRSTRSSSVSTSTAEAEIYAGAIAAQELRWLTFLLTDLGERPNSAPTLFTANNASILLCREPRLESRVKHINVRYFLLRELQRRGQACFDFVESEASTADIFTKALPPCDHQRCCVQLGLIDTALLLCD
ncbi:unnamed protein product, partial [Closterium sp. NIES-53]